MPPSTALWPVFQAYGHAQRIFDVRFSPQSDDMLASASEDMSVRMWQRTAAAPGRYLQIACFRGHEAEVTRLGWSSSGNLLASGSADGTVRLWDAQVSGQTSYAGDQLGMLGGHPEEIYFCDFISPGQLPQHTSSLWPPGGTSIAPISSPAAPIYTLNSPPQFVPISLGDTSGIPSSSSTAHGASISRPASEADVASIISPAGALQAVAGSMSSNDATSRTPVDETHLLSSSSESLFLWDVQRELLVQKADAPNTSGSNLPPDAKQRGLCPAYIFSVCMQPGGDLVAAACSDGVLRLWSLRPDASLQFVGQFPVHADLCTACTFDPSGTRIACGARDGAMAIMDVRSLEPLHRFSFPAPVLSCTSMRCQGREWLLVTTAEGIIRAHDFGDPGLDPGIIRLPGETRTPLMAMSLSRSGNALAVAGEPLEAAELPPETPSLSTSGRTGQAPWPATQRALAKGPVPTSNAGQRGQLVAVAAAAAAVPLRPGRQRQTSANIENSLEDEQAYAELGYNCVNDKADTAADDMFAAPEDLVRSHKRTQPQQGSNTRHEQEWSDGEGGGHIQTHGWLPALRSPIFVWRNV